MKIIVSKVDIAVHQLEAAIDLFSDKSDYISAITLAGAAEEILGRIISRDNNHDTATGELQRLLKEKMFPDLSEKLVRDQYLNSARNMLKHANEAKEDIFSISPREESMCMIYRAISNLITLTETVPRNNDKFKEIISKDPLLTQKVNL